jgi:hypothetical protein
LVSFPQVSPPEPCAHLSINSYYLIIKFILTQWKIIVVHRECAVEADRRNDGKKVSSKHARPNLWKKKKEKKENKPYA